jgi:hypothetical protein
MRANVRPRKIRCRRSTTGLAIGVLTLLALFATSCTKWTHPAKGQREYNSDSALCWRAVDESGETEYWPRYHAYEACMFERGWNTD